MTVSKYKGIAPDISEVSYIAPSADIIGEVRIGKKSSIWHQATIRGDVNKVEIGDFVINKMKAWQGSMAISNYRGIVSPAYHVCSIKNSNIKASTSAKKNRCDTSTYVGGLCGEFSSVVDNILAISTFVSAHSEGGYMKGWLSEESEIGDGILRSYAGNLFGKGYANAIYRIVSYKCDSQATTKKISNDPTEEKKTGWLSAVGELKENEVFSFGNLEDLENSPIPDWDNWSIQDGNPKNDLD